MDKKEVYGLFRLVKKNVQCVNGVYVVNVVDDHDAYHIFEFRTLEAATAFLVGVNINNCKAFV